jgi:hypothetical protein
MKRRLKRHFMIAAIAAMAVAAGSPAKAAEVTGRIRSINQFANTATLDNGDTFSFGNNIDPSEFHVGELVKITYRGIGSSKRALAVKAAN